MKKYDRQKIFDKYGGRCAYCGCELKKGWHADHIENIHRKTKLVGGYKENENGGHSYTPYKRVADGCFNPEKDVVENMNPACQSCNHYKSTMDLETFRNQIGLLVERLNKSFTQYKIAKRFGLIKETGIEVKFYFEQSNQ